MKPLVQMPPLQDQVRAVRALAHLERAHTELAWAGRIICPVPGAAGEWADCTALARKAKELIDALRERVATG